MQPLVPHPYDGDNSASYDAMKIRHVQCCEQNLARTGIICVPSPCNTGVWTSSAVVAVCECGLLRSGTGSWGRFMCDN